MYFDLGGGAITSVAPNFDTFPNVAYFRGCTFYLHSRQIQYLFHLFMDFTFASPSEMSKQILKTNKPGWAGPSSSKPHLATHHWLTTSCSN